MTMSLAALTMTYGSMPVCAEDTKFEEMMIV